ncbi:hypothetical protein GCM10010459_00070 [Microbacterium schleiferi]
MVPYKPHTGKEGERDCATLSANDGPTAVTTVLSLGKVKVAKARPREEGRI